MDAAAYFQLPGHPLPEVLPEWSAFFAGCRDGVLMIETCAACERAQHFPRGRCLSCGGEVTHHAAEGWGIIVSVTTVRYTRDPFFRALAPYRFALIRLPEGVRMTGVVLGEAPRIGARVVAKFGELSSNSGEWGVVWDCAEDVDSAPIGEKQEHAR